MKPLLGLRALRRSIERKTEENNKVKGEKNELMNNITVEDRRQ